MQLPGSPVVFPPPLLAGLSETDRRAIIARAACSEFPQRTVLCRQGERGGSFFLVRTGRVRFSRTTAEGRDVLLRWLGRGECFGIASLVPGPVNYMGTALTIDQVRVYCWTAASIRTAAAEYPQLAQNALRIALQYLEEYGERHVALLSRTAEQRVARTLTHLGATSGHVLPTGVEIEITNEDLASLADVGMFTVSRQMKRWERDGHVVKQRQRVLIRHPEYLLDT
jgi:CRP/FNR family transcriptional regulator, nitrogen oxide reductase regulator